MRSLLRAPRLAVIAEPFARISYTDAVATLEKAIAGGRKFEFPVEWGEDLKSEHERYLAEEVYKKARTQHTHACA
jgi:asparaginyl-tRNA synthetase